MNTKMIKSLIGALTFGLVFAVAAFAQSDPPNATVVDGGLDLDGDGTADIATPAGQVIDGDLDVDGDGTADVTKPTATVLPGGGLDLDGDGEEDLPVPDAPPGGNPFIDFLNAGSHSTVQYNAELDPMEPQLHWSFKLKAMYHDPSLFAEGAYFYELGSWVYFFTSSASQSLDGVWAFVYNFPAGNNFGPGAGTFVFFNLSGFPTVNGGADIINGWIYLNNSTYGWYKLQEFPSAGSPGTYVYGGPDGAEAWNVNPG